MTSTEARQVSSACTAALKDKRRARWFRDRCENPIGVGMDAIRQYAPGWYEPCKRLAFPMLDAAMKVIGFGMYDDDGMACGIVPGSRRGLYVPTSFAANKPDRVVVAVGADVFHAAKMSDNVEAESKTVIGCPRPETGLIMLPALFGQHRPDEVVMLVDDIEVRSLDVISSIRRACGTLRVGVLGCESFGETIGAAERAGNNWIARRKARVAA